MSSCVEVRYVSTSRIQPSDPTSEMIRSSPRIDLTPWDLALLPIDYIQKGLLFTNPNPGKQTNQEDISMILTHLKTFLSRTLDQFFPLADRLDITKYDDDTMSVYINCEPSSLIGAEFIHAVAADISVADILDPTYVPRIVNSFFSQNLVTDYEGQSQPLLSIQVTELNDGIFIGCTINHSVCDGTSFWHFFNSWSEISRGSNHISRPPILNRWFSDKKDCPIRFPFSTHERLAERNITPLSERYTPLSSILPNRVFHFTQEKIARLKTKANTEVNDHNISSLQALFAHFWLAVTPARCSEPNEETSYGIPIGVRNRLNPPLPETYFGSPVQLGVATAKVDELLERGLGWAAVLLNQRIKSHNDETIRSSWEAWERNPVFIAIGDSNSSWSKDLIVVGSSPRFNVYGNDFGWGKPVAVRSGIANKSRGKLTVFPGSVEGSIDIEACLPLEILQAMANDAEFMDVVTVLPPLRSV